MASFEVSSAVSTILNSLEKSVTALKKLQEKKSDKSWLLKKAKIETEVATLESELERSLVQGSERIRFCYDSSVEDFGSDFSQGDHAAQLRFNALKEDAQFVYRLLDFVKTIDADDLRRLRDMTDRFTDHVEAAVDDFQTRLSTQTHSDDGFHGSENVEEVKPSSKRQGRSQSQSEPQEEHFEDDQPLSRIQRTTSAPLSSSLSPTDKPSSSKFNLRKSVQDKKKPDERSTPRARSSVKHQTIPEGDMEAQRRKSRSGASSSENYTPASSINDSSSNILHSSQSMDLRRPSAADANAGMVSRFELSEQHRSTQNETLSRSATTETATDSSGMSEACSNTFSAERSDSASSQTSHESGHDSKMPFTIDSISAPLFSNPFKGSKLRNNFCSGALKIQEDPLKHMVVARRPMATYGYHNYYSCPRRACTFEGPMFGSGAHRRMDNTVYPTKSGIRYRWVFLAKSHAPLPSNMKKSRDKGKLGYKCLFCHLESCLTEDVFDGVEPLMQHIRQEHMQMMDYDVQIKTNCVFARDPSDEEDFDICIPPSHRAAVSREEISTSRTSDYHEISSIPSRDGGDRDEDEDENEDEDEHGPEGGENEQFPSLDTEQQTNEDENTSETTAKEYTPQAQDNEFDDLSKAPEIGRLRELLRACRSPTRVELPEPPPPEQEKRAPGTTSTHGSIDASAFGSDPARTSRSPVPNKFMGQKRGSFQTEPGTIDAILEKNHDCCSPTSTFGLLKNRSRLEGRYIEEQDDVGPSQPSSCNASSSDLRDQAVRDGEKRRRKSRDLDNDDNDDTLMIAAA